MTEITQNSAANFDLSALDLLDLSDPFFPEEKAFEIKGEKYIVFFLDSEMYAVPAKQVAEIFQPLNITPLPNVPKWLLGITNFRNDIISVVDLNKLWQKDTMPINPKSKLVVLRTENDDSRIAFSIDKFSEIVSFPPDKIRYVEDDSLPFINGKATHQTKLINLIDTEMLLSLSF